MYGIFQFLEQVDKNLLDKSSDDNILNAMEMLDDMTEQFNAHLTKADQNIDGRRKTTLIESVDNATIERMKYQMDTMRAAHEQEIKNIKQQTVSSGLQQQHQLELADKDQELEQIKQKYVENVNEMDSVKKEAQQQCEKLQLLEQVKQNHIVDMVKMKAATQNQHRQIQELEEGKQTFIAEIEIMKQTAQEERELAEKQMKDNLERRMKATMNRERIKMQKEMKQEQENMGKQMKHMKVQMNHMKKALKKQATPLPLPVPVPPPGETKLNAHENEALVLIQDLKTEGCLQKVFPDKTKRLAFVTAAIRVFSQKWRKSDVRILVFLRTFTSGVKDLLSFSLTVVVNDHANKATLAKALKKRLDNSEDFLSFVQNTQNQKDMNTLVVDPLLKQVVGACCLRGNRAKCTFNLPKILKIIQVLELFQKVKVKNENGTDVLVYGNLKTDNDDGKNYIEYNAAEKALPSLFTYLCAIQKDVNINNKNFGDHLKELLHVGKMHVPVVMKSTGANKSERIHLWSESVIDTADRGEAVQVTLAYMSCHFKAAFYVHRKKNKDGSLLEKEWNFFNMKLTKTYELLKEWVGECENDKE